jgi:phosphotransferase system  glucose/maltose/N-acetylglucosamine-specific IIC component
MQMPGNFVTLSSVPSCVRRHSVESPASNAGAEPANEPVQSLEINCLLWADPLTVLASCLAVLFVRTVAIAILKPAATFLPLTVETPIVDTVILATAGVLVFLANVPLQYGAGERVPRLLQKHSPFRYCPTWCSLYSMGLVAAGPRPLR